MEKKQMLDHGYKYWRPDTLSISTKVRPLCPFLYFKQFFFYAHIVFSSSCIAQLQCQFAVLMGLELQCGQVVNEVLEKKFTGDVRLGLKVLGQFFWILKHVTASIRKCWLLMVPQCTAILYYWLFLQWGGWVITCLGRVGWGGSLTAALQFNVVFYLYFYFILNFCQAP